MSPKVRAGRTRTRVIFLAALVGLALVAFRVAQHDVLDAVAVLGIATVMVFAAAAEWPEVDRVLRSRESDAYAVDRLEKIATDEAPPPTQDFL